MALKAMEDSFTPKKRRQAMDSSDWGNFPEHLLDSVLERLESLVDYLHFSDVCMPWACVAKGHRSRYCRPMLLICNEKEDSWNVFDVMADKVLDLQLKLPNKRFCGSSRGWLVIVEENFVVTLINPFSRVHGNKEQRNSVIPLPPLSPPDLGPFTRDHWAARCDMFVYRAILSADPILNTNGCTVTIMREDYRQLSLLRLGKDTTWTYINMDIAPSFLAEVVHVGDRLYGIDTCNRFFTFGGTANEYLVEILTQKEDLFRKYIIKDRFFVDLSESRLLMVERHLTYNGNFNYDLTQEFKIFEINLDTLEWSKKTTLGDGAIFLADNSAIYVTASNFPGCQTDCIYFNSECICLIFPLKGFGVYNIKTEHIDSEPYTPKAITLLRKTPKPPIWVMPNLLP